jgi:hypothetical protein
LKRAPECGKIEENIFSTKFFFYFSEKKLMSLQWTVKTRTSVSCGLNAFKSGYQPRYNLVKDGNGDLITYSHHVLNRWKNYVSQLLNEHNVSDVMQILVYTAEPVVPCQPVGKIVTAKLKKYKLPGSDQIPAEVIQAGGEMLL